MAKKNRENTPEFEDVSSYSSSEYAKKKKGKKGRIVLKSICAFFFALLILVGAGLIYVSADLLSDLSTVSITKDKEQLGIDEEKVTIDDSIKNIALFGLDSRDNTFSGNADAIMILTIDNKHRKLKMTSVLRDAKVNIDGLGYEKLNAAYAYGGAELQIKTLNQMFNLDIEDYATINFVKMTEMVDAVGGSVVTITQEEADQINENISMLMLENDDASLSVSMDDFIKSSGEVTLNGAQAVAYGRIRYIDTDSMRSDRQKKVLMGMLTKIKDLKWSDYPKLIKTLAPMCETSLDFNDILSLLPILTDNFSIETLNIPGPYEAAWDGLDYSWGDGLPHWVYVYDFDVAAEHINVFIYEEGSKYWDPKEGNGADTWTESGEKKENTTSKFARAAAHVQYFDPNYGIEIPSGDGNYYDEDDDYYYSGGNGNSSSDNNNNNNGSWESDPYEPPYEEPEEPYEPPEEPYEPPDDYYNGGEGE